MVYLTNFINDFGVPEATPRQQTDISSANQYSASEFNPGYPGSVPYHNAYNGPKCCEKCMNNPKNNPKASGFCNCVLPHMEQYC